MSQIPGKNPCYYPVLNGANTSQQDRYLSDYPGINFTLKTNGCPFPGCFCDA